MWLDGTHGVVWAWNRLGVAAPPGPDSACAQSPVILLIPTRGSLDDCVLAQAESAVAPRAALRDALASGPQALRADDPWSNLEMPGLHLTLAQAQRLWRLDASTSTAVFNALVEARFLRQTDRGAYVRADAD